MWLKFKETRNTSRRANTSQTIPTKWKKLFRVIYETTKTSNTNIIRHWSHFTKKNIISDHCSSFDAMFIYRRLKRDAQLQYVSNNVTLSHRYFSLLEWLVVSEGTNCQFNFDAYIIHISNWVTHTKFTGYLLTISYSKHTSGTFLYYRHRTQLLFAFTGFHIEAETKWPQISWRQLQMHFPQWKYINFD